MERIKLTVALVLLWLEGMRAPDDVRFAITEGLKKLKERRAEGEP